MIPMMPSIHDVVFDCCRHFRYPTTNNQLRKRNSSNLGIHGLILFGSKWNYSRNKERVICYTCQKGKANVQTACNKPKVERDDSWFKDKVLLVQAQASGQILHEEELAFLADPGIPEVANLGEFIPLLVGALSEVAVQNSNSSAQQDDLIFCD
ncbi:hypothetical protein Tco_0492840 [Tanacetum coccineum]